MGQCRVEVVEERMEPTLQVGNRREAAATQELSHHDTEDDLDLIQP